jgi:8-amino-7-oxononanoate synthase
MAAGSPSGAGHDMEPAPRQLRRSLAQRISQWRAGLAERDIAVRGGGFPVQTVPLAAGVDALALQQALDRDGVTAVPQQSGRTGALSFLLRADHGPRDIDGALAALALHIRRHCEPVI